MDTSSSKKNPSKETWIMDLVTGGRICNNSVGR